MNPNSSSLFVLLSTFNLLAGAQFKSSSNLAVDKNRAVVTRLSDTQISFSNASLRLDCSAVDDHGNALKTRWMNVNDRRRDTILDQLSNGSLILNTTRISFFDTFRCIVLIQRPYVGILLGSAVNVREPHIEESTQTFQKIVIQLPQIVRLNCSCGGYPEPRYDWYHNEKRLRTGDHNRFFAESNVLYVAVNFASLAGNYTCLASNKAGVKTSSFILEYEQGTGKVNSTSDFIYVTQNLSAAVGHSAVFECMPKNQSMFNNIVWEGPEISAKSIRKGPIFALDSVRRQHQGFYKCLIRNESGRTSVSASIYLTVKYLPVIIEPPKEHSRNRGEVARFTCNADAVPAPTIRWFKNGELVISEGRMKTFPNNNQPVERVALKFASNVTQIEYVYKRDLVVSSIRPEDGGLYQCIVSNDLGEVSGAALLVYSDDGERQGPFNLEAEVLQSKRKILLKWEIGRIVDQSRITVFILHFHRRGDVENTEPISLNDACEGVNCTFECCDLSLPLKAFTNYTFWISALLNTGIFSSPSNEILVTSWERVSDSITDLRLRYLDYPECQVELTWFPPALQLFQGTVQEYQLQYCKVDNCEIPIEKLFPSDVYSYVLQDLNLSTEYKVRVKPKSKAGYPTKTDTASSKFPWTSFATRTLEKNFTDSCGMNSTGSDMIFTVSDITKSDALLTWSYAHDCQPVPGLQVSVLEAVGGGISREIDLEINMMRLKIENLEPATFYRIIVRVTKDSIPMTILLFQTMCDQSVVANHMLRDSSLLAATINDAIPYPIDLRCTVKHKSLLLQWSSNFDLPISHFTIRYSRIVDNIRDQLEGSLVKTVKSNDTFIYINDVMFDQLYIFAVRSESEYGNSKFSDDVVCFLPKSIPPQPQQLRYRKLNETDIVIFWNLPEEYEFTSSDSVVSFHVLYETIDPQTNRRLGHWSEILIDGSSYSAHLPSLSPKSDYRITVAASNRAGVSGPSSEPLFVAMRQSLAQNSKLIENSGGGSRVIVVERKSYFEGLMFGICVAIILVLTVLCIKIGRDENFNCRTPASFLRHRIPNSRCLKRNQSSSAALEVKSCALKLISNELKCMSDLQSDRVGQKIENIEDQSSKKMSHSETSYFVLDKEPNIPFVVASIVSEAIELDIPQSVQYSTCLIHSGAVSAQSESIDCEYHDPENVNLIPRQQQPNPKSPIGDDSSVLNHPLFFSMPNLLTDSGIGFDEYCCLSSSEFSSKDNYHYPATEIFGDEKLSKKCKGNVGPDDKHSISCSSKLDF